MRADLLHLASTLAQAGEAFAMAIVVRREPASSVQMGNAAIVTERGELHGWLGGSCIQPTLLREALAAIRDGTPRLVSLSPDPQAERRPGVTAFPMTCHSGGSVDIYVEPVVSGPRLLIFGLSPVAQAVARLGKAMGYAVDAADPEIDAAIFPGADRVIRVFEPLQYRDRPASQRARLSAVVATLGLNDEEATLSALAADPAYLGVVASRQRFAQIRETLVARGTTPEALGRIRSPAGLDIGARAPEEIALSILAEIVQASRMARAEPAPVPAAAPAPSLEATDPVCGMSVAVATSKHRAEYAGTTYYFCCAGCRQRFLASPEKYVTGLAAGGPA